MGPAGEPVQRRVARPVDALRVCGILHSHRLFATVPTLPAGLEPASLTHAPIIRNRNIRPALPTELQEQKKIRLSESVTRVAQTDFFVMYFWYGSRPDHRTNPADVKRKMGKVSCICPAFILHLSTRIKRGSHIDCPTGRIRGVVGDAILGRCQAEWESSTWNARFPRVILRCWSVLSMSSDTDDTETTETTETAETTEDGFLWSL